MLSSLVIIVLSFGSLYGQVIQEFNRSLAQLDASQSLIWSFRSFGIEDDAQCFGTSSVPTDPDFDRYVNIYTNMLRTDFDFTTKTFLKLGGGDIGCKPNGQLPALFYDNGLFEAANFHCQEMTQNPNCFQHDTCPENCHVFGGDCSFGKRTWSFYKKPVVIGENLAKGFYEPHSAMKGWIKSPGHCANLIGGAFQEMAAVFIRQGGVSCQSFGGAIPVRNEPQIVSGIAHRHEDKAFSFIVMVSKVTPTDTIKVWVQINQMAKSMSRLMVNSVSQTMIFSVTLSPSEIDCKATNTYLFGTTINNVRLRLPVNFPSRFNLKC